MKILLASVIALTPVAAIADEYQEGYSKSRNCFKTEYREEYIPGTADSPGYVQSLLSNSIVVLRVYPPVLNESSADLHGTSIVSWKD